VFVEASSVRALRGHEESESLIVEHGDGRGGRWKGDHPSESRRGVLPLPSSSSSSLPSGRFGRRRGGRKTEIRRDPFGLSSMLSGRRTLKRTDDENGDNAGHRDAVDVDVVDYAASKVSVEDAAAAATEEALQGQRALQEESGKSDEQDANSPPYWWHENTPDERDVVYVFHDIQSFSSGGNAAAADADHSSIHDEKGNEEGKPKNAIGGGQTAYVPANNPHHDKTNDPNEENGMSAMSSSANNVQENDSNLSDLPMTVYSINIDNNPDVSDLPHKQPSRTPTLPPTRLPTSSPTRTPTHPPTQRGFFFPLWTDVFKGCTEGGSPPEEYTLTSEIMESYLFGNKNDCCATWFGADVLQECLDDGLFHGLESNGVMETYSENGDDSGGRGGTSHTDWSYDEPQSPPPPPSPTETPAAPTTASPTLPPVEEGGGGPVATAPVTLPPTPLTVPIGSEATPPPSLDAAVATDFPTMDMNNNDVVESTPWPTWSETTFPTPFVVFEVTSNPTLPPGSGGGGDVDNGGGGDAVPQDVPTPVPNPPPAFEQFVQPSNPPILGLSSSLLIMDPQDDGSENESEGVNTENESGSGENGNASNGNNTEDNNIKSNNSNGVVIVTPASESEPITFSTTTMLYSESFESGVIDVDSTHSSRYFTWSLDSDGDDGSRGDGHDNDSTLWNVAALQDGVTSFDLSHYVVRCPDLSSTSSSSISLAVGDDGSNANPNARAIDNVLQLLRHGAMLSFAIKLNVAMPLNSLAFSLDGDVIYVWEGSGDGSDEAKEWNAVSTYLPPTTRDGQTHTFTWTYVYNGNNDGQSSSIHGTPCQLDAIVMEALTGDVEVTEENLEDIATGEVPVSQAVIPSLDIMEGGSVVGWNAVYDGGVGGFVLLASTEEMALSNDDGGGDDGKRAGMSFTIITGSEGGVVSFDLFSSVFTPLDVLEIAVDDIPVIIETSMSEDWKNESIELRPGKHVVTFHHIANPANMPDGMMEQMVTPDGYEGVSKIRGLKYKDNAVPALDESSSTNEEKTEEEGDESPIEVTTMTVPSKMSEMSQEVQEDLVTITLAAQNYCGTVNDNIRETCAQDDAVTCNAGDPACPSGTVCFGNIECEVQVTTSTSSTNESSTNAPTLALTTSIPTPGTITQPPTDIPTFSTDDNDGGNETGFGCAEGTTAVPGLAGCCVADPSFLGDGACDPWPPYNTAECGYDLGDCCKESCNPDSAFGCNAKEGDPYGPFGFFCLDPQFSKIDAAACNVENREWIGDGGCDSDSNIPECGYDNGDCCRQTCDVEKAYFECGNENQPFDCKDPDIIYRADYVP